MNPVLFFIPFLLLAIGINFIWYWIKEELRRNGYKVYYFHSHFQDLSNFSKLIADTTNSDLKEHYLKMKGYLKTLLIILAALVVGSIATLMYFVNS